MEININFRLEDYEVVDMPADVEDPQDLLLTPGELADRLVQFLLNLNNKGQLQDPVIRLPWWNDDSEDIAEAVFKHFQYNQLPCTVHFEFMSSNGCEIKNSYDHSQRAQHG